MEAENSLLRRIPQVDALLQEMGTHSYPPVLLREALRRVLDELRRDLLSGRRRELPASEELCRLALSLAKKRTAPHLRPVLNGTGVILHTNLGRACLSPAALAAIGRAAAGYSNLEYDLERGERGSRYSHVEALLASLTGCESSMVVNNNAGAVLVMLSALARGKEVVVSRGELVEIGGSFRVPEVMEQGGAILREVGTTNKTRPEDYAAAVGPQTGALLKVHTSNYRIVGFTGDTGLSELAALGRQYGLPVLADLGSGALIDPERYGIRGEPWVAASLAAGADVVTFSGDKLLGGPQAGIICGREPYIAKIKEHPLTRALRIDKLCLAALEATLAAYLNPERAEREIPLLTMLARTAAELKAGAERLRDLILRGQPGADTAAPAGDLPPDAGQSAAPDGDLPPDAGQSVTAAGDAAARVTVTAVESQVGGGSVPHQMLPSWALAIEPADGDADGLAASLRRLATPIIGRIAKDRLLLDLRCLREEDFPYIAESLRQFL